MTDFVYREELHTLNAYRGQVVTGGFLAELSNGHLDQLRRAYEGALRPVFEARARHPHASMEAPEVLEMRRSFAERHYALDYILDAFVIALSHLFEREMNRAMRAPLKRQFDHNAACSFLRSAGRDAELETVKVLVLTSNVIKHGAGRSSVDLYRLRPAMFDEGNKPYWSADEDSPMPGYEDLVVTEGTVDEFFDAVRSTLPERDPHFYEDIYARRQTVR